jgi:hypothetical protein
VPQKKTVEMTKAEMDQAIKSTRPIDDELARVIFKDERAPELVQTILRTIPALKNVVVTRVNTQYDMPSLGFGKGYHLDIYATDSKGSPTTSSSSALRMARTPGVPSASSPCSRASM